MNVLVTGGGGFLGRAIVERLLKRGLSVRVLTRSAQPELELQGVECQRGDISDSQVVGRAVEGVDAVFHVAAKAGVWGSAAEYIAANVTGTRNVIEACHTHGVRFLVHTSTPSVVFSGEAFDEADESTPYGCNWLCPYPQTKAEAEQLVLAVHGTRGLRTVALRPHLIWGPGDPHLVPRLLQRADTGRLRIVGDGTNRVDLTYIDNAADAHLCAFDALQTDRCGGNAYFITNGEPVVLWDWVNELLQAAGRPPLQRRIGSRAAYAVGAVLESVYKVLRLSGEPPMTRFVAIELAKSHTFSIDAARRDLGYVPKISMKEGMRRLKVEG